MSLVTRFKHDCEPINQGSAGFWTARALSLRTSSKPDIKLTCGGKREICFRLTKGKKTKEGVR